MPKNNEARYKVVKLFIESGNIKRFIEIFDQVPKSVIASELRMNTTRFTRLMEDPFEFKLRDLQIIANLIKVDLATVVKLTTEQEIKRLTGKNIPPSKHRK